MNINYLMANVTGKTILNRYDRHALAPTHIHDIHVAEIKYLFWGGRLENI